MSTIARRRKGNARPPASKDGQDRGEFQPPPKLRRRPYLWILGLLLIAGGGVASAWIATTISDTTQVVGIRNDVDRGAELTANDLVAVPFSGDPQTQSIPADQLDQLVGQRAARDLTAGGLLVPEEVTSEVVPTAGQSLLGIGLKPGQMPAEDVRPGSPVRLINTPREQEEVKRKPGLSVKATVVRTTTVPETGQIVVDVVVPKGDANTLAALSATGRVALVVDGS